VSLTAETRRARTEFVGGGAALAGMGVASAGVMVVLGALLPVALIPVPVALGVGYGVARQYRSTLARIQLGLERALDQLEHHGVQPARLPPRRPPGLMGMLAEEIRRSLR
jgi:CHASE2 domain-containing sensor protein